MSLQAILLRCAVLWVVYLALAGTLSAAEIATGFVAAGCGAALSSLLARLGRRKFSLRAPWPWLMARVLMMLVSDTVKVGAALARASFTRGPGLCLNQPFSPGGEDAAGRRALVTLLASITPDRFVLDIEQRQLALHRLVPAPPDADPQWPV
jgi:hypothetical protein